MRNMPFDFAFCSFHLTLLSVPSAATRLNHLEPRDQAAAYEQLHISDDLCWHLYADAVVLQHDGSLLDCASMAIHAALADTLVPLTTLGKNEDGSVHVEIHDSRTAPVLDMAHVPLFITLAQVSRPASLSASLSVTLQVLPRTERTYRSVGYLLHEVSDVLTRTRGSRKSVSTYQEEMDCLVNRPS